MRTEWGKKNVTPLICEHFKGRYYLAIGSVEHSDHHQHVIYQDILTGKAYSRPEKEWGEEVSMPDGTLRPRFRTIKFLSPLLPAGHTMVAHCKREPYDVFIGRPSKWGNPFYVDSEMTREKAIEKYVEHLINHPTLLGDIHELQGKVLGCFCKPKQCHGDILARIANSYNFCLQ